MNAKEKAKELMTKFNNYHDAEKKEYIIYQSLKETKRCALITCDEVINATRVTNAWYIENVAHEYWKEVKQEIEKY
jgi:hypothetical protein